MLFLDPFSDTGDELVELDVRVFRSNTEIINDLVLGQKTLLERKIESSYTRSAKAKYSQRHAFTLDPECTSSNDTLCIKFLMPKK